MSIAHNLIDSVRYLAYRIRFPSRTDILKQSFGIARRARDFAPEWELHRSMCRAFARESLALNPAIKSINIIGAGRLFDLDMDFLSRRVKHITLIDLDPSVRPRWAQFARYASGLGCTVSQEQIDVTGVFDELPAKLDTLLRRTAANTRESLIRYLSEELPSIKPVKLPKSDVTFSLNILSQLPILFRERIIQTLLKRRIVASEEEVSEEISDAIAKLSCALQQAHLETLQASSANLIVLIADKRFEYYRPDCEERQVESALYFDVASIMSNYIPRLQSEWMWHIAPYGKNSEDYGSEHVVGAWAWVPKESR